MAAPAYTPAPRRQPSPSHLPPSTYPLAPTPWHEPTLSHLPCINIFPGTYLASTCPLAPTLWHLPPGISLHPGTYLPPVTFLGLPSRWHLHSGTYLLAPTPWHQPIPWQLPGINLPPGTPPPGISLPIGISLPTGTYPNGTYLLAIYPQAGQEGRCLPPSHSVLQWQQVDGARVDMMWYMTMHMCVPVCGMLLTQISLLLAGCENLLNPCYMRTCASHCQC